mgnify:CR=1 FL=1
MLVCVVADAKQLPQHVPPLWPQSDPHLLSFLAYVVAELPYTRMDELLAVLLRLNDILSRRAEGVLGRFQELRRLADARQLQVRVGACVCACVCAFACLPGRGRAAVWHGGRPRKNIGHGGSPWMGLPRTRPSKEFRNKSMIGGPWRICVLRCCRMLTRRGPPRRPREQPGRIRPGRRRRLGRQPLARA